jgi:hypothetical protein
LSRRATSAGFTPRCSSRAPSSRLASSFTRSRVLSCRGYFPHTAM